MKDALGNLPRFIARDINLIVLLVDGDEFVDSFLFDGHESMISSIVDHCTKWNGTRDARERHYLPIYELQKHADQPQRCSGLPSRQSADFPAQLLTPVGVWTELATMLALL